jgi:serine/threonine-protein kinase
VTPDERRRGRDLADQALRLRLIGPATHEQLVGMFAADSPWHGVDQVFSGMDVLTPAELAVVRRSPEDWRKLRALPRFRDDLIVLQTLGEGGMGLVHQALDTNLDRIVAIKVVRPDKLLSGAAARMLARFEREAKILATLDHPSVVRLLEAKIAPDGSPYMLMDFVRGQPLDRAIQQAKAQVPLELILKPPKGKDRAADLGLPAGPGALPCELVARWGLAIAGGLAACHERGIIHRDIKPANLLITEHGEVRLIDFGVAFDQNGERLTKKGVAVGTACYMAPEMLDGKAPSAASDIYALGATLYECLTGRPPFEAPNARALCIQLTSGDVPPLRGPAGLRPDAPAALEAIVLRCLEQDPLARYPDVGALGRDLEAFLAGELPEPVEGETDSKLLRRLKRFLGRSSRA